MIRRSAALLATLVLAAGLAACTRSTATAEGPSRQERVRQAFQRLGTEIAAKDGLPTGPTGYLRAGMNTLPSGTELTLWVSDPGDPVKARSRCFYLDEQHRDGVVSGYTGCGVPGREVSLSGDTATLVGSTGTWGATAVKIEGNGTSTEVPVTAGYFLVPSTFTKEVDVPLTLTLLDEAKVLGTVTELMPPGSAVPQPPSLGAQ
ncbi:hypothetical protein F4553_001582 [Allocatelliglobosispora scoriae]|uniref:Lipoprotein n=1 Tax=Allocatelliglobosispora scoriae TaxID=643052 RepID=A0A841BMJ7_9ACTN|nr:hypothetical protein [Allocatelliglobosispora scoriae]MBB5868203.1 hypothetical protein [Allocatelliglobosispora scoriae]